MAPTMFLCQAMFWKGVRVRWYFSPHLHRSQKSKNEPTEKTVSGQQRMLSYSHLKGMERPVRSFKSFIRTTPSRTSPNKPVPPIPRPLQKIPSSSSVTSINSPSRSTGFSLWEAPSNWDNSDNSQIYSTPPLALRKYSPLIPEPPEDIAAMQTDPALWQLGNGPFPQTALDPIHECNATTPEIPARNPSRLSLSMSKPASTRENSRSNPPSVGSRDSTSTHDEELVEEIFEPPVDGQSSHDVPSPLDLMSALSDMTIKEQAFHSLGIGSPRDQGIVWGGQPQRSDSLQFDNDAYLDSQGNKLITPKKRSFLANDSSFGSQDPEIGDGIHALSFVQDYHNILSDQPFDDHTPCEQIAPPKTPPKDQDLTPRPLEWRKGSDSSPSADVPERPLLMTLSSSGQRQKLKKMGSWVSQHLKSNSLSSVRQKSISAPDDLPPCQVSDSEVDRHPKKEARLANIVQHGKDFVARKVQRRTTEPQMPLVISLPLPQHSAETPEISSVSAAPFELATPLFKLPGGLAIVRQSPLSTPRPQTAGNKPTSPTSPFSNLSWPDFPASSSFRFDFSRRGSCASSCSQVRSSTPMKERLRSFGSLSSIRSFARSSTSPAIPTTQEPSCSYSLPQLRRRSHNVGSPLSLEGGRTSVPEQTSVSPQGAEYDHAGLAGEAAHKLSHAASKLNLLEKAKNARDAWKKVQEEIKKEKLKQSIRLVGPASATDIAGYIKPDSRASGDSGIDEGRLEGSMSKETI